MIIFNKVYVILRQHIALHNVVAFIDNFIFSTVTPAPHPIFSHARGFCFVSGAMQDPSVRLGRDESAHTPLISQVSVAASSASDLEAQQLRTVSFEKFRHLGAWARKNKTTFSPGTQTSLP